MFTSNLLILSAQATGSNGWQSLIMIVLIFVVFYFFMIRPQMKKAKDQKKYRESLAKGDKVVTIGGIHGKIIEMEESAVILEMHDNTKIKVEKAAISMDSSMSLANKR